MAMDLDSMLMELGQLGKFQLFYLTMLIFPVIQNAFRATEYEFTTMDVPHRCRVPECEGTSGPTLFSPSWLKSAIPMSSGQTPAECLRYRPLHNETYTNTSCPADLFSSNSTQTCSNWVFAEPVVTIANDFGIMCEDQVWELTALSSFSVVMLAVGMPFAGILSDRFGRKNVMVWSCVTLSVTGIIRSFTPSYATLAPFELFDGLLLSSIYNPAFCLGVETLAPEKRLLGNALLNIYWVVGEVMVALIMWAVQDWRVLLRVFYIPFLAIICLHWLLTESVRWLYTQGRYDDVINVFKKIARLNKTEDKLPDIIKHLQAPRTSDNDGTPEGKVEEPITSLRLGTLIRSRIIMGRLAVSVLIWIVVFYAYFGVSQDAVYFGGNRYLSFALVSLAELPAYVASVWVPDWQLVGRRGSMSLALFLAGLACLALNYVTVEQEILSLVLFFLSKCCPTFVMAVIYVYTAELFPTELRQTLLSVCCVFGSVGIVLAQQTPLLRLYIDPMLVLALVSGLGGALMLTCPETLNTKMPDTIKEAEEIGKTLQ